MLCTILWNLVWAVSYQTGTEHKIQSWVCTDYCGEVGRFMLRTHTNGPSLAWFVASNQLLILTHQTS
jgi:hypothetical protein